MEVLHVSYRDPKAPELFARSIKETGFAVLRDHPISIELIKNAFGEWEKFFAQPSKFDVQFDPAVQAGYFPFKTEKAKDHGVFDLKEFFHYYPNRNRLPAGTEEYTPVIYKKLFELGRELLSWIEENTPAEIRAKFSMPLLKMVEGSNETLLRPIHYPPLSENEEAGAIRAAAHEDINLITLLPAATAPGLQVKDIAGKWHDVSCNLGEIAINAGDMLQMASGGYFVSTTHRVVNPSGPESKKSRYSMPLFLHPAGHVPLSAQHTAKSYLEERLQEIGLKKT